MGCLVELGGPTVAEAQAIERLFQERDEQFSRFRENSELSWVNRAPGEIVMVSGGFAEMLERALTAAAKTDGLVDPTLGEAIEAAGYDRDFDELTAFPEPARPGPPGRWRSVRLAGRLLRRPEGLLLDLNGVVKGQTVDEALALIAGEGFVSAGGDYAGRGAFDVALPDGEAVRVTRGALATSGKTRRRWIRAGVWQHHLIDPRTGSPAVTRWEEVTVSAATCLQADVAAKAAFLLGDHGPEWLNRHGLAGRFLGGDGETILNGLWRRAVPNDAAAA
jgi:FAD:protein FMN transferase